MLGLNTSCTADPSMAGHGRSWQIMAACGSLLQVMAGHGSSWQLKAGGWLVNRSLRDGRAMH